QEDLLVGVASADRGRPAWELLVGYFLNPVAVRNRYVSTQTFRQAVEATRERLYRGLEHQDLPFPDVVRRLAPRRDPSRASIIQTMFIWDRPRALPFPHAPDLANPPAARPGRLTLAPLLLEQRGDSFDLTLVVFAGEDGLTARFSYSTDLFDRERIE